MPRHICRRAAAARSVIGTVVLAIAAFAAVPSPAPAQEVSVRFDYPSSAQERRALRKLLELGDGVEIANESDGVLVLDYQRNSIHHDGTVDAQVLSHALTRLALVPPRLFPRDSPLFVREIVVRNVVVQGSLKLSQLTFTPALVFEGVTFQPIGREFAPEAPVIEFRDVDFHRRVEFSDGTLFHGRFYITRTGFGDGLHLSDTRFGELRAAPEAPLLRIDKSIFKDDLHLLRTQFAPTERALGIYDSVFDASVRLERISLGGSLQLHENQIGDLRIAETNVSGDANISSNRLNELELNRAYFHGGLLIEQNIIDEDLTVTASDLVMSKDESGEAPGVQIRFNVIGREFEFSPANIRIPSRELILSHNTIHHIATINVPWLLALDSAGSDDAHSQPTLLDLSHTVVDGRIVLRESTGDQPSGDEPAKEATLEGLDHYCYDEAQAAHGAFISLKQARFDTLVWGLPLGNCDYRWMGEGMSFDEWLPLHLAGRGRLAELELLARSRIIPLSATGSGLFGGSAVAEESETASGPDQENDQQEEAQLLDWMNQWKYQMVAPDPTFFLFLSDKLMSQGNFIDSRDMLQEAKRLSYVPNSCRWLGADFWSADHCFRQTLVFAILWPSGFGARPELSLVWLALSLVTGLIVYKVYSVNRKTRFMLALWPGCDPDRPGTSPTWLARLYHRLFVPPYAEVRCDGNPGMSETAARFTYSPASAEAETARPQMTYVAGFRPYDETKDPKWFPIAIFNFDAALPVVNFHTYDAYYPDNLVVRVFSCVQHGFGWWMVTLFVASLAIL